MKNFIRFSIALVATFLLSLTAVAENGFDYFAIPRTVVLTAPQLIKGGAAGNLTNGWIDIHSFIGVAQILLVAQTNTTGTLTATIQNSDDGTNSANYINLASIAQATSKDLAFTNTSSSNVTNTYLMPGTITTATAATAGFAGTYLVAAPYTNSGAITFGSGPILLGFNAEDAKRYIRVIWAPGGTDTNVTVCAVMTGRRQTNPVVP